MDVKLLCVRWHLTSLLSLRSLEEMMAERGVEVSHSTVHRWDHQACALFEKAFRRRKRPVGTSWRMDETYVKVGAEWEHRAVDKARNNVRSKSYRRSLLRHPLLYPFSHNTSWTSGCGGRGNACKASVIDILLSDRRREISGKPLATVALSAFEHWHSKLGISSTTSTLPGHDTPARLRVGTALACSLASCVTFGVAPSGCNSLAAGRLSLARMIRCSSR